MARKAFFLFLFPAMIALAVFWVHPNGETVEDPAEDVLEVLEREEERENDSIEVESLTVSAPEIDPVDIEEEIYEIDIQDEGSTEPDPQPEEPEIFEEGIASWYGSKFHGRRTANGEIYDMYDMTAAHKELEFGTLVRVTHSRSGRQVDVRINDRGPFIEGRVIDLSMQAAQEIGLKGEGIAEVTIEVLETP